jgi:hypothetical protein
MPSLSEADLGLVARISPALPLVREEAHRWAAHFDWLGGDFSPAKLDKWNFCHFSAALYPDANPDAVAYGAHLTHWIAVLDDWVEREPSRIAGLREAHFSGTASDGKENALVRAWQDIAAWLSSSAGDSRAFAALGLLFDAYQWETTYRASERIPPLSEYRRFRHLSGGVPLYLLIVEKTLQQPLEETTIASEWFSQINASVGTLMCWANDLWSAGWDKATANPMNLVRVAAHDYPNDPEQGARTLFAEEWQRFLRSSAEAPPGGVAYTERLPALVAGTFAWMRETRRYQTS